MAGPPLLGAAGNPLVPFCRFFSFGTLLPPPLFLKLFHFLFSQYTFRSFSPFVVQNRSFPAGCSPPPPPLLFEFRILFFLENWRVSFPLVAFFPKSALFRQWRSNRKADCSLFQGRTGFLLTDRLFTFPFPPQLFFPNVTLPFFRLAAFPPRRIVWIGGCPLLLTQRWVLRRAVVPFVVSPFFPRWKTFFFCDQLNIS